MINILMEKVRGDLVRPNTNINLDKIIANTRFMQDLSIVLYGAELALKLVNVPDAQITKTLNEIVLGACSSLELDFNSLFDTSVKGSQLIKSEPLLRKPEPQLIRTEPQISDASNEQPQYAERTNTYRAPDFDLNLNEEHPATNSDLKKMYQRAEKTYDSHMDDDEDFERMPFTAFQHEF